MGRPASEATVAKALGMVGDAERAFTSRWNVSTLRRIDPGLHDRLQEQRDLFNQAIFNGTGPDVDEQAAATVRGWRAACQRMEQPLQPDDAYLVGHNLDTFTRVVIGHHKGSAARQQFQDGHTVIFITPDEVAAMFGAMSTLRTVKELFPDSEILNLQDAH
jgi:hypothetical protein